MEAQAAAQATGSAACLLPACGPPRFGLVCFCFSLALATKGPRPVLPFLPLACTPRPFSLTFPCRVAPPPWPIWFLANSLWLHSRVTCRPFSFFPSSTWPWPPKPASFPLLPTRTKSKAASFSFLGPRQRPFLGPSRYCHFLFF